MKTVVILILATQILLSNASSLDVLPKDDKSSNDLSKAKVTDLKSGVQLLYEHLVQELECNDILCGRLMVELFKTYNKGAEFSNEIDVIKSSEKKTLSAFKMTAKLMAFECNFIQSVYTKSELLDCHSGKFRDLQYQLLTLHHILKLKGKTDDENSNTVGKCSWLKRILSALKLRVC